VVCPGWGSGTIRTESLIRKEGLYGKPFQHGFRTACQSDRAFRSRFRGFWTVGQAASGGVGNHLFSDSPAQRPAGTQPARPAAAAPYGSAIASELDASTLTLTGRLNCTGLAGFDKPGELDWRPVVTGLPDAAVRLAVPLDHAVILDGPARRPGSTARLDGPARRPGSTARLDGPGARAVVSAQLVQRPGAAAGPGGAGKTCCTFCVAIITRNEVGFPITTGATMGKLAVFGKVAVVVRTRDHNPPHFHVVGPDLDVQVLIDSLIVEQGTLPSGVGKQILAWAAENRDRLIAEWNRVNPDYPL
jgi:hypothetical protein